MIRRELKSQLIELEKRYAPVVRAKRDKETAPARWAHFHALQVAAVASYGEPKMEEPLRVADSRIIEKLGEELFIAAVDEWWSAALRPDALRRADDNLKFERIFLQGACLVPEIHWHRMGCKASGLQTSQTRRSASIGIGSQA